MSIKRNSKRLVAAAIAVAGLAGGAVAVHATTFSASVGAVTPPSTWPSIAPTCTADCTIDLYAGPGSVTVDDVDHGAANVPFLGFGVESGTAVGLAGDPVSVIKVPQGTTLTINLTQHASITDPIDLSFPSLPVGSVTETSPGVWVVDANTVGTSVFQPGNNPGAPKQISRGLVGVLIVTPAACSGGDLTCAYDGTSYDDEALIATTDLDLEFALDPAGFDMGYFGQAVDPDGSDRQVYHFINGKSFPDTDVIDVRAGDDVLLRYVNAGVTDKAMGLLGLRQSLLARNASAYPDPQTLVSPLIGPGETADVAVSVPASAPTGQFYALVDSGRQMNSGTSTGFGGALTFLHVWAALPSVDSLSAVAGEAPAASYGNPLVDRAYATDFPPQTIGGLDAVLVVLAGSPLPAGTLESFETWNQATTGSSPNASEGEQLRAYVLRPTANANEYNVVHESAVQTVPAPAVAGMSEVFSFPANVPVQAGDVIAYFGSGVPVDTSGGTDSLIYPALAAPANGDTITLGSATYPIYPQARTYSFAATVTPYSGTTAFAATAHASGAGHNVTGYQTVVNAGATPGGGDWSVVSAIGPSDPAAIATNLAAIPGQTIWVRAEQDGSVYGPPASIVVPAP